MELWGGIECTINRVGDQWHDQCEMTGHNDRYADIDLLAEVGFSALRYPVLWEHVSPDRPDLQHWNWLDPRLTRLHQRGVRIIAGLIHHGSGPHYTNLLDPEFANGLARHAGAVAARYPWIDDWTPVNEPLTTARFAALYGHWYPHVSDERACWIALLNQIDGVRGSMRAIRAVNPRARLIQTEDLGRSYATAPLRQQAAFDNLRRWATWDLLCGRVTPDHRLFARMDSYGLGDRLRLIADDPCPPDLIGVNHYLTSDRFLDHRAGRYPDLGVGGNGRDHYVDVEATRVLTPAPQGLDGVLREAWRRYGIPLAVTEVHNGCTREEQLRWMAQAWDTGLALAKDGIDLRAITSWGVFGNSSWNTLLTRPGSYEPGVFDVSNGVPRATAMVELLKALPAGGARPAATAGQGWWERPIRVLHPPTPRVSPLEASKTPAFSDGSASPILICGASGTLGQALARACVHRGLIHILACRETLALDDPSSIARALDQFRPWAVINAAGWVKVDDAEIDQAACLAANATGAVSLAAACDKRGIGTVTFSSDLVFDGELTRPYIEDDIPTPLSFYGESKHLAEQAIASLPGQHLVIRTAAFFSAFDQYNFAMTVATTLGRGARFVAAFDEIVSPTYVPHLADAALDLAIDRATGIWHLTNSSAISWSDFAQAIAAACKLDASLIDAVPGNTLGRRALRPRNTSLISMRGQLMPSLDCAIHQFAEQQVAVRTLRCAA